MKLTTVYARPDRHIILWQLLKERDASVNISHREMPSYQEHVRLIESRPYEAWYFIDLGRKTGCVGACYLTRRNEIGVQVFEKHQGKGYGKSAVSLLMTLNGSNRFLANVNPRNERSAALFKSLGFSLVQHTYALTPSKSCETSSEQSVNTPARHTA